MRQQIALQAGTIKELIREISRLEREGVQQAERIAELEALLFAAGVLDKDGQMKATDADKRWYASQVLERYEVSDRPVDELIRRADDDHDDGIFWEIKTSASNAGAGGGGHMHTTPIDVRLYEMDVFGTALETDLPYQRLTPEVEV